jgi:uncharacterized protein YjcR
MKDISVLVSGVREKAQMLVRKLNLLENENENLRYEIENIRLELKEKNQLITKLNERIKLLKIAGGVGGESTKEVKLKINEMVREIDKCIAKINR